MYRLTLKARRALIQRASWPDGRCRIAGVCGPSSNSGGGKSGLHGDTVAANGRRGRPQGKCHRKQTACGSPQVRVKGCGKSAPRGRRRSWQGKPHREQDQIGVAGRARKRGARSVIRPATRVGCLRRPAMGAPDEWPSRRRKPSDRTRLTGQLAISLLTRRAYADLQCSAGWLRRRGRRWRCGCGRRRRGRRRGRCLHGIPNDAQDSEHGYGNEDCSLIHDFSSQWLPPKYPNTQPETTREWASPRLLSLLSNGQFHYGR